MIKVLLLDAANTIIHKPGLWDRILSVLNSSGYSVELHDLKRNHKIISELINFPDRTSEAFYNDFNRELLYSLGVVPSDALLSEIFKACSYLPWHAFNDTAALSKIVVPISVVSNFNASLNELLKKLFTINFREVIISENERVRKPDPEFFKVALNHLEVMSDEVLYVGDSVKLDMEPALSLGIHAFLIDRDDLFPAFKNRIKTMEELPALLTLFNTTS